MLPQWQGAKAEDIGGMCLDLEYSLQLLKFVKVCWNSLMQLPSVQDAARCCKPQEIFVFCTHLDHRGMLEAARPFSAGLQIQAAQGEILLKEVETFCDADDADVPRLVLGDFNSWPGAGAHPVLLRHGYHEASQGASAQATFVGFGSGSLPARFQEWMCKVQIDYIFGTKNLELKGYSVHHNTYKAHDGRSRNLSDHCMISAQVRMARAETWKRRLQGAVDAAMISTAWPAALRLRLCLQCLCVRGCDHAWLQPTDLWSMWLIIASIYQPLVITPAPRSFPVAERDEPFLKILQPEEKTDGMPVQIASISDPRWIPSALWTTPVKFTFSVFKERPVRMHHTTERYSRRYAMSCVQ